MRSRINIVGALALLLASCGNPQGAAPALEPVERNIAGVFNGATSNVHINLAGPRFSFAQGYTVEAFVRLTGNVSTNGAIFHAYGDSGTTSTGRLALYVDSARRVVVATRVDCNTVTTVTASALGLNIDYHLVATFDGNSTLRIFINGDAQSFTALGSPSTCFLNAIDIGADSAPGPMTSPFQGFIDEVRFSTGVRYPSVAAYSKPTKAFVADSLTNLLIHFNASDRPNHFPGDDRIGLPYLNVLWTDVGRINSPFF